jgi:hypothetical protein
MIKFNEEGSGLEMEKAVLQSREYSKNALSEGRLNDERIRCLNLEHEELDPKRKGERR